MGRLLSRFSLSVALRFIRSKGFLENIVIIGGGRIKVVELLELAKIFPVCFPQELSVVPAMFLVAT